LAYLDRLPADGDLRADPEADFDLLAEPPVDLLAVDADLALLLIAERPLPVAFDDEALPADDLVAAFAAGALAPAFLAVLFAVPLLPLFLAPEELPADLPLPAELPRDELLLAVALLPLREAAAPLDFLAPPDALVFLPAELPPVFLAPPDDADLAADVFLPADAPPEAFLAPADDLVPADDFLAPADDFFAPPVAVFLPPADDPRAAIRVVVFSSPTAALTAELVAPATAPVAAPDTISPTTSFAFS
jgi:hypothetical protein